MKTALMKFLVFLHYEGYIDPAMESSADEHLVDEFLNSGNLTSPLTDLPENTPLYKDSGRWQLRSDDMEDVVLQQSLDESDIDFLNRCRKYYYDNLEI